MSYLSISTWQRHLANLLTLECSDLLQLYFYIKRADFLKHCNLCLIASCTGQINIPSSKFNFTKL